MEVSKRGRVGGTRRMKGVEVHLAVLNVGGLASTHILILWGGTMRGVATAVGGKLQP